MLPEILLKLPFDRVEFAPGQTLPSQEDGESCLYILLNGCVTLKDPGNTANTVFWPEDLVAGAPDHSLKAASRTEALRVCASTLLSVAWQNEDLIRWLWQQQQMRQTELLSRISLLTKEGVHRRVILTLAGLSERSGGNPMPLAQKELADLAGATRETTSTLLNRMRRRGLVQLGRRMIRVSSSAALRDIQSLEESDSDEASAHAMAMAN